MPFFPWLTDFDDFKRFDRKAAKRLKTRGAFYEWRNRQIREHGVVLSPRNEVDCLHYDAGQAYYNVHSQLVAKLARVNLEKVPASMVEMPQGLRAVNIRLDRQHDELTFTSTLSAYSVAWHSPPVTPGSFVHSFIFCRPSEKALRAIFRGDNLPVEHCLLIALDANIVSKDGVRTICFAPLFWTDDQMTLAESVEATMGILRGTNDDYREILANCLRLAVTIGFLANSSDELIEPDIIARLRERYRHGGEQGKARAIRQSRARGHHGYNVGNDFMFLGEQPRQQHGGAGDGQRELQWQHIRDGHPHAVRYGPKHSKVKLMWFKPTTVRPDLPFKS
jgi:hypothetical protein